MSHYQVEGNDPCDWTTWGDHRCDKAVDAWSQYESDADLAREAGANAFRFSVSWSRCERDERALDRYSRLIDHLNAIGLEPAVTLFHYTHPVAFHEETPWTSTKSVKRFVRFAQRVVDAFGDRVRLYIPFNEPLVFLLGGFLDAQIPPGIADGRAMARAFDNIMAAHAEAAHIIRNRTPRAAIGVAHNMMAFAAERKWNPLDHLLAHVAHRCYNIGVLEAFATGRWDFVLPPLTRIRGRRNDLPDSLDFFGVNFYSRLHLRCPGRQRRVGDFAYRDVSGRGLTDNGWEIVPEAFESLLQDAAKSGFPLVVTENGIADEQDRLRARFLEEHVTHAMKYAHGYFHWSLVDNYEWLDGFGPKFGLYAVDRTTMKRSPRKSVEVFRRLGRSFTSGSNRQLSEVFSRAAGHS